MFRNSLPVPLFAFIRALVVVLMLTSCVGELPKPKQTTLDSRRYEIDGLTNGLPSDLSPLEFKVTSREVDYRDAGAGVTWSQREFESVRVSFLEQVLRDVPERWEMGQMRFRLNCRHVGVGLQEGSLLMFRNVGDWRMRARVERQLGIFPKSRIVTYWEVHEAAPDLQPWVAIEMKKVKVSADQALQIAERTGGSAKRAEVKDDCRIWIEMNGWEGNTWRVSYTYLLSPTRSEDFVVIVDAETGNVK